jgi:hypothetical protein
MYFNEFELDALHRHRIDDLRQIAKASRQSNHEPRLRIALAHALIALASLIWHEEAEQAAHNVALA